MAVPQNRKTPSKRGMHRSHDALSKPPLGGPKKTPSSSQSALSMPLENVHLPETL